MEAPAARLALHGSGPSATPHSPQPHRGEQSPTLRATPGPVEPGKLMRMGSAGRASMLQQGWETLVPTPTSRTTQSCSLSWPSG